MQNFIESFFYNKKIQVLIYSIFSIYFFYEYLGPNVNPGDNGDGKSIVGLLENIFIAFSTKEISIIQTFHLYLIKDTLFFGDTYFGLSWIYIILRYLSFDIYVSYKFLFFITFLVNFISCYFCCKYFKISDSSSLFASFFFTFGFPVIAQDSHYVLLIRAYVPICIILIFNYFKTEDNKNIIYFVIFFFLQLTSSTYITIFLFVMSIITIIILMKKKSNNFILGLKKQVITIFDKLSILQALIFILIFLVIIAYISKYISVLSLFDFSRGYDSASLINLFSFIHTDRSPFWPHNLIISGYPKHEQQLYMGLSFFLLVTFFYYYKKILLSENNIMLNLQIVFFTTLVFTSFMGLSIYFFLHFLPGFSGMRVGCRSILVILFPLSVFIALSIDRITEYNKKFSLIFVLIVFLLLIEISLSKKVTTNILLETKRIQDTEKFFKQADKDEILVFKSNYSADPSFIRKEIDHTFLSNIYGIKTLNGTAAFIPKGYYPMMSCEKVFENIKNVKKFYIDKNIQYNEIDENKLVFIGFEENCLSD